MVTQESDKEQVSQEAEENPRVVKLTKPVFDAEGEAVSVLRFPEPETVSLGELGVLDDAKGQFTQMPILVHVLCNIPLASAKKICWKDLKAINKALEDFLL